MANKEDLIKWIKHGRQKRVLVQLIKSPITIKEISIEAKQINPRITIYDTWSLIQDFKDRGFVYCLNPSKANGKLYFLTNLGREIVAEAFGSSIESLSQKIDWDKYAVVASTKLRKLVLLELAKLQFRKLQKTTVPNIRKSLNEKYPISYNLTYRILKELEKQGLINTAGITMRGGQKIYHLSPAGEGIVGELLK